MYTHTHTHTHTLLTPFLVILFLATSFSFANADSSPDRSCRKKVICADTVKAKIICADELIVKTGCSACHTITAKDFMDVDGNLSQTFVITEPGKYCLGENIIFTPLDQAAVAIQILANDVHLDLCGNTLTQGNDTFEVFAIQIGEGFFVNDPDNVLKNITITNGNITHFTGSGIFCYNASFDGPTTQAAFEDLTFTDLNILDCGTHPSFVISGIYLESFADDTLYDPATRVAYKNVIIENCHVNRCMGNGSIYIYTGDNIIIQNTQANETVTEISVYGISLAYYITARNLQMFNCQGNGTTDLDPTNRFGQAAGGYIVASINVYIKDCQFNNTFGKANLLVQGANLSSNQNAIYENVQFNNARGGDIAYVIQGVHMSYSRLQQTQGNGEKFINCQFNGTTRSPINNAFPNADFYVCAGVRFQIGRNITFDKCQFTNIGSPCPDYDSYGAIIGTQNSVTFPEFSNMRNVTFTDCIFSDIASVGHVAAGIHLATENWNFNGEQGSFFNGVIQNCVIERISSGSTKDLVAGIAGAHRTHFGPNFIMSYPAFFNLFCSNNRISDVKAGLGNPMSAGIVAESVHRPNILNNSMSDCDCGILLTGTDLIVPDTLFQLATSLENAEAFPPVFINLTSIPAAMPLQFFTNLSIPGQDPIEIAPSPSSIDLARDYIFSPVNLNTLGWQLGDMIFYDCNGGDPISDLVCSTTYFAIVYRPGFSERGVIQNNTVDNCTLSGYQDNQPITSSAWINNYAFNNGAPATRETNYDIGWASVVFPMPPVMHGDLALYPTGSQKVYNVSLVP